MLDLESHFTDLTDKDAPSLLNHQLVTIIDRINRFIGDNQDNVGTISQSIINHETRIEVIENPPIVFGDFTDSRLWHKHNFPWSNLIVNKDSFIVSSNVTTSLTFSANYQPFAGLSFAPLVFPDANGEIDIRVRISDLNVGPSIGTSAICAGIGFLNPDIGEALWGMGKYAADTDPYIVYIRGSSTLDSATAFSVVEKIAGTYHTIRLLMSSPRPTVYVGEWSSYYALNDAPLSATGLGSSPAHPITPRSCVRGFKIILGFQPNNTMNVGFSAKISNFEVVKGTLYWQ